MFTNSSFFHYFSKGFSTYHASLIQVGNLSHLLTEKDKVKFSEMINEAFNQAEYDEPTIVWSDGETMAAFHKDVAVKVLSPLKNMKGVDRWRTVERFHLFGATEHGPCQMLVFNTHQPSSDLRPFGTQMRVAFCKAIIHDALRVHSDNEAMCGWIFGGDANCSLTHWTSAFKEIAQSRLTFDAPSFVYGLRRQGGDLMVAAGLKGGGMAFFENTCTVEGREDQHDCMFIEWSYKARATDSGSAWQPYTKTDDEGKRPRLQEPSNTLDSGAGDNTTPKQKQPPKEGEDIRPKQDERVTNVS